MQNSLGAIIGAIVIGVALLILLRWELVVAGDGTGSVGVFRLDRWTVACVSSTLEKNPPAELNCEAK
ncbi:MAG TPA: hypothetical protein VKS24_13875 [Bradyrhizobium sp.]|nr:hypothetical protein [Bradyrhizobium sp.]